MVDQRRSESGGTDRKHTGNMLFKIVLSLVILNFGVWGIGTVALHGDALSGKAENGKYFLAWKGEHTEVSRSTYVYSYIHTFSTAISIPAAILFLAVMDFRRKNRRKDEETLTPET